MTFFDYSIYDIPAHSDKSTVSLNKELVIIVDDDAYANEAQNLLTKILSSVNQDINQAQVIALKEKKPIDIIQDKDINPLVIIFGLTPKRCGLQVERRLYLPVSISNSTYIFSSALNILPKEKRGTQSFVECSQKVLQIGLMKIVFATHNQHKVEEIDVLLEGSGITFQSLVDVGITDDIIEDGATMEENAWIKTNFVFHKLGGNVMADDSGLEVDALNGAPGIISARYAGPSKDSEKNIDKVLEELGGNENRRAQFRSVLAVILNGQKWTFEGVVRGRITEQRSGTGGFGYDPIFEPEGYDKTFGELSPSIKNTISHRARAMENFISYFKKPKVI